MKPPTTASSIDELLNKMSGRSVALLLGAGISIPVGIPTGYNLPIQFAYSRPDLMAKHDLVDALDACARVGNASTLQSAFTGLLTTAFEQDEELQEGFLS